MGVRWKDKDTSEGQDARGSLEDLAPKFNSEDMRPTTETNKAESLYDGASTTGGSESGNNDSISEEIGGRETAQVTYIRFLVILVLLLAAGAVSALVYVFTKGAENQEFETKFDGVAAKVLETFEEIVSEKLAALSAFSVTMTAYARSRGESFPFVTINDFQQRAGSIREVVGCLLVYTCYNVDAEDREDWEAYSRNNTDWYYDDLKYQEDQGMYVEDLKIPFSPTLFRFDYNYTTQDFVPVYEDSPGPFAPIWQSSPLFPYFPNYNGRGPTVSAAIETGNMAIGGIEIAPPGNTFTTDNMYTALYSVLLSTRAGKLVNYTGDPMAYVALPLYDGFEKDKKTVGTVSAMMNWGLYFEGIVSPRSKPVTIVLENCDGAYTYQVDSQNVVFQGRGDLHMTKYNHLEQRAALKTLLESKNEGRAAFELEELGCPYHIRVYPTQEMEDDNKTHIPIITTFAVAVVFLFTAFVFGIYNRLVENRQRVVLSQATESTDLVSTFLPSEVQKRLLHGESGAADGTEGQHVSSISRLKSFLSDGNDDSKPIADLFPFCTVLYADISGFTAWSSSRDPSHVFTLLQTVYKAFDQLAKKHKVFKVETIGDSYVAVTGLPNDQPIHAILMARFAWDCMLKMNSLVKQMERTLGPDTCDLAMRFGMHSGPVTAGVLRGDRPRFQLFGDTVNTAARMEHTSKPNRIQVSHTTAAEIEKLGKAKWLTKREDIVKEQGAGVFETYWLVPTSQPENSLQDSNRIIEMRRSDEEMHGRLVDWCVELLLDKLRQIQALRQSLFLAQTTSDESLIYRPGKGRTCMDEVREVMALPPYNPKAAEVLASMNPQDVEIDSEVVDQLHGFVAVLSKKYNWNPFHNWEHACHVIMATNKFLNRILSPNMDGDIKTLHEYTHGLTSDPLLLMGIILSSVIHDVDHRGVSNMQMAKEEPEMAELYQNKSIAEQNSLDIAWDILMRPEFGLLRRAMFNDRKDMLRFRQVIVTVVLATDIFDKELNDLRKARWNKAFSEGVGSTDNNLRATIVIEHVIQASDISHTMQHWHVYIKWNERLFWEMREAFRSGRMGKDPAEFWYKGELGFFDNYIIPLAKKLKDCNVFGVSSDECLNFAVQNRKEWEQRGEEIVQGYIKAFGASKGDASMDTTVDKTPLMTEKKQEMANKMEVEV